MIVPTMSLPEVAAAARKDLVHLQRKIERDRVRLERQHKKSDRREALALFGEYTSPEQLQWMFVLTVSKRRTMLYPMVWYFSRHGLHSMHLSENGSNVYFEPHVLLRYRQRFDRDADVLQSLRNFFQRNHSVTADFTPNTRFGDDAITGALDDGLVLGYYEREGNIAHFNTYITADMAGREQEILKQRLDVQRYFSHLTPGQARVQAAKYLQDLEELKARLARLEQGSLGSAA